MSKSLKYITSACLLSSAILCGAAETAKETTQENPQALLEQVLKETTDNQDESTSNHPTIAILKSAMRDDPATLILMALEDHASGSLSRAVSNVAMLHKLTSIDDKLQQIVDVLSNHNQSSQ